MHLVVSSDWVRKFDIITLSMIIHNYNNVLM